MIAPETFYNQISEFFVQELSLEAPAVDEDLIDTGILDSLIFVQLVFFIENEYGLEVSVEELEIDNFRTIEQIGKFINRDN